MRSVVVGIGISSILIAPLVPLVSTEMAQATPVAKEVTYTFCSSKPQKAKWESMVAPRNCIYPNMTSLPIMIFGIKYQGKWGDESVRATARYIHSPGFNRTNAQIKFVKRDPYGPFSPEQPDDLFTYRYIKAKSHGIWFTLSAYFPVSIN